MSRDRDLQKLVNDAETERMIEQKEALDNEREERIEARAPKKTQIKPSRKKSAFLVISGARIGLLWWFGLATALIAVAPLLKSPSKFMWIPVAMVVAFLVRVGFMVLRIRRDYPGFVRFPDGLGFKLDGGEALIDHRLLRGETNWEGLATLRLTLTAEADQAVYDAVLGLFAKNANERHFYWPGQIGGASTDPRKQWKREGHEISGSMNMWVVRDLYKLVYQLETVHARIGGIERASFKTEGTEYSVSFSD